MLPILLGLVQIASAALALMAAKKRPEAQRRRISLCIFSLAIIGIGLTTWQAIGAKRSGEESTRKVIGDADHPPYVAEISLPNFTRFIVSNTSEYPAYGIRIRVYDTTASVERPQLVKSYEYAEIPAHSGLLDDYAWVPPDNTPERRFRVDITTRTGVYWEQMILRRAGNNQWGQAVRVMQGMRKLFEDVHSDWPRNAKGEVDWDE